MDTDELAGLVSQRFAADLAKRHELLAAIAYVEGAQAWGSAELVHWFEAYLAARQVMPVPGTVKEAGSVVSLASYAPGPMLSDILVAARARVVRMVSGMLAQPVVDAFLSAAIFAGRVARKSEGGKSVWRATPSTQDTLSDVVLSLIVADILAHRDFYEAQLAVCVTCGRISFEPGKSGRTGCREHPLARNADADMAPDSDLPPVLGGAAAHDGGDEIGALRDAWADELFAALGERSGWAHLGSVEIAPPNGLDAVGGYADRHTIDVPYDRHSADALAAWRRTGGSRLVERAVVYANNALLLRAPPPKRLEHVAGPWPFALDPEAPNVVLGSAADCARVVRATRDATRAPIPAAVADVRPGLAVVLSGRGVACWIVADVSISAVRGKVTVGTRVEVRSRAVSTLRRVDISLV